MVSEEQRYPELVVAVSEPAAVGEHNRSVGEPVELSKGLKGIDLNYTELHRGHTESHRVKHIMPKIRKTLGKADSPYIVSLRRLIESKSKATIAEWCISYAETHILHIFEKECPGDFRPRNALSAARDWLAGNVKLPAVKKVILYECHAAARELNNNPVAQAAARACGQAASAIHVQTHALGLAFYGSAAIAYQRFGVNESAEIYNQFAAEECTKLEADLRAYIKKR